MTTEKTSKDLLISKLNQKLYFAEIEEKLLSVTYSLTSDKLYTVDHALPELIKIINLLEQEQRAIMHEIDRLYNLTK